MGYIFALITIVVYVLYIAMLLRMLFDWVRMFDRSVVFAAEYHDADDRGLLVSACPLRDDS